MKTNLIAGKVHSRLVLLIVCVFFSGVLMTGCKKDNPALNQPVTEPLPQANLVPDEDETEYSMANYQDALDDVTFDGDRLIFNNMSHFVITAMALDSIGDSTAQYWFQGKGFTNSLYDEYVNAINSMPDAETEAEIAGHFSDYTNSVKYDADNEEWDINAINGIFARLLNSEHKAVIGDNIYYSNYDVSVLVGTEDESLIPTYSTQGYEQDDEYAIVLNNRVGLKTTGSGCLNAGWVWNMGVISCGNPAQKKATVQMEAWRVKSSTGNWYSGAIVRIWHSKRGLFGMWFKDPRGSQVGGVWQGKYFNQAKIYQNSAYLHEYGVYITQAYLNQICFSDIEVCVAPMCSGNTICQNW